MPRLNSTRAAMASILASSLSMVAAAQTCDPQWLSGAIPNPNGTVFATAMWDPDGAGPKPSCLVVGGSFTLVGSTAVSNLALWDGVAWADIGGGVSGTQHGTTAVNALAVLPNGDLVVGGAFDNVGVGAGSVTDANCIARYNGTSWSKLGLGVWRTVDTVRALAIRANGDLVAIGGIFLNTDNSLSGPLARWSVSDPIWRDVTALVPNMSSYRTLLTLASGDIVVGGVAGGASGASSLWRWSDSQNAWIGYGSGVNGQVLSLLLASNGDLVAGGNFTLAGGVSANSIARWNGSAFAALGSGITYPSQPSQLAVRALAQMPNGDIVAGGQFDTAGGNVGGRIARWNGSAWARLPQGAGDIVWTLLRTPQDLLAIGGAFTFAGGSFANKRIALFTDLPAPYVAVQPVGVSMNHDGTVMLSATPAAGFSTVSVRWQRNNLDIADGPGGASVGGGTVAGAAGSLASPTNGSAATLTITHARAADSGSYTAIFTNACGNASSSPASVSVGDAPCPADFNGDGFVDGFDYDDFVACFEGDACPPGKTADFNNDGFPDGFDYDDFVQAFEAGCL